MKLGTQTALLTISQYGCAPAMPERKKFSIFGDNEIEPTPAKQEESQPSQHLAEEIKAAFEKKEQDHEKTFEMNMKAMNF